MFNGKTKVVEAHPTLRVGSKSEFNTGQSIDYSIWMVMPKHVVLMDLVAHTVSVYSAQDGSLLIDGVPYQQVQGRPNTWEFTLERNKSGRSETRIYRFHQDVVVPGSHHNNHLEVAMSNVLRQASRLIKLGVTNL